jgi:hypothetical protein
LVQFLLAIVVKEHRALMIRAKHAFTGRLRDQRSRQVVFVAHCVLNENTRYLGGACRRGCIQEIVQQCIDRGVGMVQMPCPEEEAWGGVLKTWMLRLYGVKQAHPFVHRMLRLLLPVGLLYTRLRYWRIARRVARQIEDYVSSGFAVRGVVGIDGSPTCGVRTTLDIPASVAEMAALDPQAISVGQQNALVRRHLQSGSGIFIRELQRELRRRRLSVPFLAHDLIDELDGRPSGVKLFGGACSQHALHEPNEPLHLHRKAADHRL